MQVRRQESEILIQGTGSDREGQVLLQLLVRDERRMEKSHEEMVENETAKVQAKVKVYWIWV